MRGLRGLVRRRAVVHTRDDQSIRGVLVGVHRDCVELSGAEYLGEAQEAKKLEGSAVVPRDNVAWLQMLEG